MNYRTNICSSRSFLIYYHCHSSALHGVYATMGYVSPPQIGPPYLLISLGRPLA